MIVIIIEADSVSSRHYFYFSVFAPPFFYLRKRRETPQISGCFFKLKNGAFILFSLFVYLRKLRDTSTLPSPACRGSLCACWRGGGGGGGGAKI
jgi:hypothetical protein